MPNRDNQLWLEFWRDRRADFHQLQVNQLLIKCWPELTPNSGKRVFVPLCGKSLDMLWLAKQGYEVVGVELSPVAVKAFFSENHLPVQRQKHGLFTVWRSGRISIFCGDFFALSAKDLGSIDKVYDRSALTALPETIRQQYVQHLQTLLPAYFVMLLLTVEVEDSPKQPVADIDQEVSSLFAKHFDISLEHAEKVLEPDPDRNSPLPETILYKVYRLSCKLL